MFFYNICIWVSGVLLWGAPHPGRISMKNHQTKINNMFAGATTPWSSGRSLDSVCFPGVYTFVMSCIVFAFAYTYIYICIYIYLCSVMLHLITNWFCLKVPLGDKFAGSFHPSLASLDHSWIHGLPPPSLARSSQTQPGSINFPPADVFAGLNHWKLIHWKINQVCWIRTSPKSLNK